MSFKVYKFLTGITILSVLAIWSNPSSRPVQVVAGCVIVVCATAQLVGILGRTP